MLSTKRVALAIVAASAAFALAACGSSSTSCTPSAPAATDASSTPRVNTPKATIPATPKPVTLPRKAPSMPSGITAQQLCAVLTGILHVPYKPITVNQNKQSDACYAHGQDGTTPSYYNVSIQVLYNTVDPRGFFLDEERHEPTGGKIVKLTSWAYIVVTSDGFYTAEWVASNAVVVLGVLENEVPSLAQPTVAMTSIYRTLQAFR